MEKILRFGNILVLVLILSLVFIAINQFGYWPSELLSSDSEVLFVASETDYDGDGIDDYTDILNGAKEFVSMNPKYKSAYYEGGYPSDGYYVSTDIIWYALDNAGYDFKSLIDEDIKNNIDDYDVDVIDTNIDFRRIDNILVFLDKYTDNLTTDVYDVTAWQGGDIVVFEDDIAIVSDKRNSDNISYIIHHDGNYNYEEDILTEKKVVGHYRFNLDMESV